MGIKNLYKLIQNTSQSAIVEKTINDYKDKIIIIDTSIVIYQYVIAIRNSGKDLENNNGHMTSHIIGIINKALSLLNKGIIPVFVLDGKANKLKDNTLQQRKNKKDNLIKNLENNNYQDEKDRIKDFKKTFILSNKHIIEIEEILNLFGIPNIRSNTEADPLCALLVKKNLGYAVASEDMDILTFGSPILIKGLSTVKKFKEINLNIFLDELNINFNEFIDLCILLGCDYIEKIPKIGVKKAVEIITKYRNLETFLENERNKYIIPDNYDYQSVRDIFNYQDESQIKSIKKFKLKKPKYNLIKEILVDKYNINLNNVNNYINKLKKNFKK